MRRDREKSKQAPRCLVGIPMLFAFVVSVPSPLLAEIVVLANGRTMKLASHRVEADLVVLMVAGGGEISIPASQIAGILPDEVMEEIEALPANGNIPALVDAIAARHGIDPKLVRAVVSVESAFRPDAVSPKGATGLMQLMPATAAELGVVDAKDPEANVDGGVRYLLKLLELYKGDLTKALAAYNAGPGAVERHKGVPPYRETQAYVRKVMKEYKQQEKKAAATGGSK